MFYTYGNVIKMNWEWIWEDVVTIAGGIGHRAVFPAPVVIAGMLGC